MGWFCPWDSSQGLIPKDDPRPRIPPKALFEAAAGAQPGSPGLSQDPHGSARIPMARGCAPAPPFIRACSCRAVSGLPAGSKPSISPGKGQRGRRGAPRAGSGTTGAGAQASAAVSRRERSLLLTEPAAVLALSRLTSCALGYADLTSAWATPGAWSCRWPLISHSDLLPQSLPV